MYVSISNRLRISLPLSARDRFFIVGLAALLLFFHFTSNVQSAVGVQDRSIIAETMVVHIEPLQDMSAINAALAQQEMVLGRVWPEFGLAEVHLIQSDTRLRASNVAASDAARLTLEALPGIQQAEVDRQILAADRSLGPESERAWADSPQGLATELPTDSLNADQWAHERLSVFESWDISRGSPDVVIAVIDSGYELDHEDISPGSLWINVAEEDGEPGVDDDLNGFVDDLHGWDWIENDDVANDPYGHGTHVGGAIAADTNNALGISSLSPDLRIAPLRVLDGQGAGQISDLIDALYYAFQQDIDIVNMSLVIQINSYALQTAVRAAAEKGMVLVGASGNHSTSVSWPAKYPEVVAVSATDRNDVRGPFSNFGAEVELAAPGVDILSTYRDNSYHSLSGTSMAAAHVSALAGLIWGLRPDLSAEELRTLMWETSLDVNDTNFPGVDDYLGAGRINFYAALSRASADLGLSPISTAPITAHVGESTVTQIAVIAGKKVNMAINGAVVHYQLLPAVLGADNEGTNVQDGWVATNANGIAAITFPAPDSEGKYVLRLQVGLATHDLPVEVIERLSTVALTQPNGEPMVGDTDVPLRLEFRNGDGQPIEGDAVARLRTDMGLFDNGRTEMDVTVMNSTYTLSFHPGYVAGTARLTVQFGNAVQEFGLVILPGQAEDIGLTASVDPLYNWAASGSASFRLNIVDGYGNSVADGTPVRLVADRGLLADTQLASLSGSVSTTLTVEAGIRGPAYVRAMVPGTDAETQVAVPLMSEANWLPIIAAN